MALTKQDVVMTRKYIEMMTLLNIYLNHFPRHEKYALCNQIRNTAIEMRKRMTRARKHFYNKTVLRDLDVYHEELRDLLHIANELHYFDFREGKQVGDNGSYLKITRLVDELGAMIGAWIKKVKADQGKQESKKNG